MEKKATYGTLETAKSSGTATSSDFWGCPERIKIIEYPDKIEMIYKEVSNITYTMHPAPPPSVRVYKIVFSCVDGKWNKSEKIFGKIIPPSKESYEF